MSIETFKKLPGVLSFQRLTVLSDALFFSVNGQGARRPLDVVRHGIRGTQNVNGKTDKDVSNIQVTESAKTASDATGFEVEFSVAFLPLDRAIHSCAGEGSDKIREAVESFVDRARGSQGVEDVALRYARNILNGRWLWRNRLIGHAITVSVFVDGEAQPSVSADALSVSLNDFDNYSTTEVTLGKYIAASLNGSRSHRLRVVAQVDMGFVGAVEVFPSQNFVSNKPSGFARPLYKVDIREHSRNTSADTFQDTRIMGHAALRDQKVGNALRTIDTWYAEYGSHGKPIAVEPMGANLDAQRFFRDKKDTSFKLMANINAIDPSSDDGKFLIASLIRGGVYGESDKAEKEDKKKKKDAAQEVADEG